MLFILLTKQHFELDYSEPPHAIWPPVDTYIMHSFGAHDPKSLEKIATKFVIQRLCISLLLLVVFLLQNSKVGWKNWFSSNQCRWCRELAKIINCEQRTYCIQFLEQRALSLDSFARQMWQTSVGYIWWVEFFMQVRANMQY